MGISQFVNYSELLRSVGIPDSKEKLKRFLNKVTIRLLGSDLILKLFIEKIKDFKDIEY